jgi:Ca-activated chloride channel family protein
MFIKSIQTDFIDVQGTAIADAINLAMNSFSPENDMNKAIIVISDGENHEGDAILAATSAKEKGVVIHTIGIGSDKSVPIPDKGGSSQFKKDQQGEIVMTKLNEEMLQEIAQAGGGIYVKANNSTTGLDYIYEEINKIEKGEITSYAAYDEKFHYFVFAALVLLFFEFFVLERKNRVILKIKLFK